MEAYSACKEATYFSETVEVSRQSVVGQWDSGTVRAEL
jgi:hypothetical protein